MQNITSGQLRLLENLQTLDPDLKFRWDEGRACVGGSPLPWQTWAP